MKRLSYSERFASRKCQSEFHGPRYWTSLNILACEAVSDGGVVTAADGFIPGIRCTVKSRSSTPVANISARSIRKLAIE